MGRNYEEEEKRPQITQMAADLKSGYISPKRERAFFVNLPPSY